MPPWQCTDIDLVTIYVAHAARSPSAPPAGCCLRRRPVEQCNKKEKACTYAGGSSAAAGGERRISSRVISLRRPAAEPWSGGWGHRRTISHMRPQSLTLNFFFSSSSDKFGESPGSFKPGLQRRGGRHARAWLLALHLRGADAARGLNFPSSACRPRTRRARPIKHNSSYSNCV